MKTYRPHNDTNPLINRLTCQVRHCQAGHKTATQAGEYCVRKCKRCNRCRAWKIHKDQREGDAHHATKTR